MPPLAFKREPLFCYRRHARRHATANEFSTALFGEATKIRNRPNRVPVSRHANFSGSQCLLTGCSAINTRLHSSEGVPLQQLGTHAKRTSGLRRRSPRHQPFKNNCRLFERQFHGRHQFDGLGQDFDPIQTFNATSSATAGGACRKCFVFST
jgi:hypothetical protein